MYDDHDYCLVCDLHLDTCYCGEPRDEQCPGHEPAYRVIPPVRACEAPSGRTYSEHDMAEIAALGLSSVPLQVYCTRCGWPGTIELG